MAETTYTVVKGDCLTIIAEKVLGKTSRWTEIAELNNLKSPYTIYVGDTLKMPGSGGSGNSAPTDTSNAPTIDYFGYHKAGNDREMLVTWKWTKLDTTKEFRIVWSYYLGGRWFVGVDETKKYDKELDEDGSQRLHIYSSVPENATKVKVKIKPIATTKKTNGNTETAQWTANWSSEKDGTCDLINSPPPPQKPTSKPTVTSNGYKLTVTASGLDDLNATHIDFEIDKNSGKSVTTTGAICEIAYGEASYIFTADSGSKYRFRCRSCRAEAEPSEWSDYSDPVETLPAAPAGFDVCRAVFDSKDGTHGVHLEWKKCPTADKYVIEFSEKKEYFDISNRFTTTERPASDSDSETITYEIYDGIESGKEYYFRLRISKNVGNADEVTSPSAVSSVRIGEKPAPPTTWSSTTRAIFGEPLNLYWVHNTVDGSSETRAELTFTVNNETYTRIITKNQNEDEPVTSVYQFHNDPVYITDLSDGAEIKWTVRTQGILPDSDKWSDPSTERTIEVFDKPKLDMKICQKANGEKTQEIRSLPFYIQALPGKSDVQTPISYHVSITSNDTYETVDELGNTKIISQGSEVYSRHFDISSGDPFKLDVAISAGDISLENNVKYTVACTVGMDSGLTAKAESIVTVYWSGSAYVPNAEIGINKDALTAYIRPYIPGRNLLRLKNDLTYNLDGNPRKCDPAAGGEWKCYSVEALSDGNKYTEVGFKCNYLAKNISAGTTVTAQAMLKGSANVRFFYIMTNLNTGAPDNVSVNLAVKSSDANSENLPTLNPDEYQYFSNTYTVPENHILTGFYIVTPYHNTEKGDTFTLAPASAKLEIGSQATVWSEPANEDGSVSTILAVYRREFDGTFTEIATDIDDSKNTFVVDPHPSLDFARYRIVATSKDTGSVGYYDVPGYPVEEQSIVIQWDEEWTSFDVSGEEQLEDHPWSGSLLKLPYNISVSDKTSPDVSNIKYIGRKHPVAYYGTHVGQTSSWSTVIPKDDIETLYALRRLSMWMGDVYVREPSGIGYWANLRVSLSQKHNDLTIPVSFEITRIEGGM